MIVMSITMFVLGLLAFFDAFFNYGSMFRMIFAGLLIASSIWVYLKTKDMGDLGKRDIPAASGNTDASSVGQSARAEAKSEKKPEPIHQ